MGGILRRDAQRFLLEVHKKRTVRISPAAPVADPIVDGVEGIFVVSYIYE